MILVSAILLAVSMGAFGVFLTIQLSSTADAMYDDYLSGLSGTQAESLQNYLTEIAAKTKTIAEIPAVQQYTDGDSGATDEVQNLFDSMVAASAVSSAVIYDNSGKIVLGAGIGSAQTLAEDVCKTDAADYLPVIDDSASQSDKSQYFISVRAKVNDYDLALVFAQESGGVRAILRQSSNVLFAVDPNGSIITTQTLAGSMDSPPQQYQPYKDAVANATTTPTRYRSGEKVAYATATESGWVVVANDDASAAGTYSASSVSSVIGISILLFIIFFVAVILLVITVTKPLYKIEETLLKISRGDHEARIEIMSRNEYGDIARVFNDIVDDIIVSESRYRTIIEMSDNIIFEWNFVNNEVIFSNNFNKKFSYRAPSDHFADSFLLKCKVHPDDADRYKADLEKLAKGENFKHNEYRWKNIYGDYIWVLIRTATIVDKAGTPIKSVGVIVDIDRAKKSENMLTARASFDSLTGVYNRETIESAINNEIELIAARKNQFAILFVDIDDFKFYNDQYSHATGDQVLRFTATTIRNAIGDKGMAGRYGGDEFIICIRNSDQNDPAKIAEQILNTLKEGFDSDSGDHLTVNVSIGISIIRDDSKRVEEIIGMADDAMYRIKKSGKSNFGFLEEEV
ncbi:MAG: diguanylate cyclase [Bacteroides sp.]|nr:diguanylate cyclase [Eubacterium sp.]MCM1418234.1 diguanylate cyclase [Roseburia sp.]MCM1463529.1 diguanylate cyclase [Bacteroides sp.]